VPSDRLELIIVAYIESYGVDTVF